MQKEVKEGRQSLIPKTIHYCWFGRKKKPGLVKKCIKSWKKHCPDYTIIEWNEDTYDIASSPLFVRQALEAEKWAFAADYVRYRVVYEHGGIYLDTDVEIIKNIDFLLSDSVFFGVQHLDFYPASGLGFGAEKNHPFLKELMRSYEDNPFRMKNGAFNQIPCPVRDLPVFCKYGFTAVDQEQILENGVHIYPTEYFCPRIKGNPFLKKTANTVMIHRFAATWLPMTWRIKRRLDEYKYYFLHNLFRFGG
ncbi:MAG: glycosyltransferase [Eubacteriales bacterium]|nr:glycosyltransferase [Eubacteriales bacterium]